MAHRRSLFRYYADQKWADAFLGGQFRFWSLAYFRDLEDKGVRGDENEGTSLFRPEAGLQITNHTQGTKFTMPNHTMTSAARQDEILVFCASRSFSASLWDEFSARVCFEITDIPAFCARVRARLPREARFPGRPGRERLGQRVEYYRVSDAPGTRWALPDRIASSKLADYSPQDEFRLVFSVTGALAFQNLSMTLVPEGAKADPRIAEHKFHDVSVGSLRDICLVHETKPAT
ncbi:MAG: hypothetical protein ABI634_05055 [Acidobacteriota bacterium]